MITSIFKKSTPFNFVLILFLMLVFFFGYQIQDITWLNSQFNILKKVLLFLALLGTLFLTNFIARKNNLSKDSAYTAIFFFLFLLFFPPIFNDWKLIIANFFVLLAYRRLASLQTLKKPKEKIFDASLWIFLASLFHFWCILYFAVLFIAVIFHVASDYRNFVLPFIALLSVSILFFLYSIIFNLDVVEYFKNHQKLYFSIDYFSNTYQNLAFSIYATVALFFVFAIFGSLSSKPQVIQPGYKMVVALFFIGVIIFVVSPNKSNNLLLFTIAPLSILATSFIEGTQIPLKSEMVFYVLFICGLFTFFTQI